jgi:hypothetical protein
MKDETMILFVHEVTMRLLEGETEIVVRINDERSAMGFEDSLRRHLGNLGIDKKWPHLNVALGPEIVVVSTRPRVEKHQS